MIRDLYLENLKAIIELDIGFDLPNGDITTELIEADRKITASITAKENLVLCGVDAVRMIFSSANLRLTHSDGDEINGGQSFCTITGSAKEILKLERTALNIVQTMSGTATLSRQVAGWVKGFSTQILDTRKTLPGLRYIQKYAVAVGGCSNHRLNLSDDYLIKDNHIKYAELSYLLDKYEANADKRFLVVEVDNLEQFDYVISRGLANRVMLDNFLLPDIEKAVAMNKTKIPLEVSGIPFDREVIVSVASIGIDFISIGALTKNVRAADISMEF